jgi:NAD-dependent deacetylase
MKILPSYKNIVVLTGAGISSESGLKTFRDANGLWEGHRVEEVASPDAFIKNPELVHQFYNLRRRQLLTVNPNLAHKALAEFEASHMGQFTIITQNVDDLHERAGSKNVLHMHGELRKVRCLDTEEVFAWDEDLGRETPHPKNPQLKGRLRPHICWFGEIPFFLDQIDEVLTEADLFIAIGTSGVVYPAAGLVTRVPPRCRRVLLNKDNAENNPLFDEVRLGPATEIVPEFLKDISS